MNREDIIKLAREIGDDWWLDDIDLERFATLVAAAERERIIAANAPEIERINAHIKTLEDELAAIRARGETK